MTPPVAEVPVSATGWGLTGEKGSSWSPTAFRPPTRLSRLLSVVFVHHRLKSILKPTERLKELDSEHPHTHGL